MRVDPDKSRLRSFVGRIIDGIQNYSPTALIIIGIALAASAFWKFDAKNPDELGRVVDTVIKLLGIAVVGILLPRLISLKFGGAEIGLSGDNGKAISESMLALERKLSDLREEVGQIKVAGGQAVRESSGIPREPPELPPPTTHKDTQKGRFGGSNKVDGYSLLASFPSKYNDGDVVRVKLEVRRDNGKLVAPVRFYLDETFPKNEFPIEPNKEGIAVLEMMIWGGFTVGAWPEETAKTLLELDLSEIPKAPLVVKSR